MPVDEEVKDALDAHVVPLADVTARRMFGGVCYMVGGKMFVALMEGVVAMKLPDELRAQALTLAGVSPFRSPSGGSFGQWIQFVLLMAEDVPAVAPWLDAAYSYVSSAPPPKKRRSRKRT